MLHAAFVRSPFAHAKILAIDTSEASRQEGVSLVMTGAELAGLCTGAWLGTLACFPGMRSAPQHPMAVERACWAGEPVVLVVASQAGRGRGRCRVLAIPWLELPCGWAGRSSAREHFARARIAASKAGEIQAFDVVLSGAGAYSQYPRTSVPYGGGTFGSR